MKENLAGYSHIIGWESATYSPNDRKWYVRTRHNDGRIYNEGLRDTPEAAERAARGLFQLGEIYRNQNK